MEARVNDLVAFLQTVPLAPVELIELELTISGASSADEPLSLLLCAPHAARAGEVKASPPSQNYSSSGRVTVLCSLELPGLPGAPHLQALVLAHLAFHVSAVASLCLPGAPVAATLCAARTNARPTTRGVDVEVSVPSDLPNGAQILLQLLTVAGEPVSLNATVPTITIWHGPDDLTPSQAALLQEWIGGDGNPGAWRELYRATRDGFRGADFHRACDDIPNVLVLAREKDHGWLFGGYTAVGFKTTSSGQYHADPAAFLFSLDTPLGHPEKLPSLGTGREMVYHSNYSATFGDGCDLYIGDNSDMRPSSGTCTNGRTFARPSGQGRYPLAQDQQGPWQMAEIVAFAVSP
jgi:hypothetical protein